MSLYYEAADLVANSQNATGSLASRVYNNKTLKSKPAHVYALVSEATKWSDILSHVIEKTEVLRLEKKVRLYTLLVLSCKLELI